MVSGLTDSEHLRLTFTTCALSGRFAVLHLDLLGTLDLYFFSTFHAIRSH